MNKVVLLVSILFGYCLTASSLMAGEWTVSPEQSSLSYLTVKKTNVMEVHSVPIASGNVSANGKVVVNIDFAKVESGVKVRNERLRQYLFQVAKFPIAVFESEIDMDDYKDLKVGDTLGATLEGQISMLGVKRDIEFDVLVTRISKNSVLVVSSQPVVLLAKEFNLEGAIEKLREIAKLPSISTSTAMTFRLLFNSKS